MIKILLLGCGGNAGINFIKSVKLSNDKIFCYGVDIDEYNILRSHCDKNFLLKKNFSEKKKIDFLKKIIKKYNIDFVHAQPDIEVKFLLKHKKEFKNKIFNLDEIAYKAFENKHYFQKIVSEKLRINYKSLNFSEANNKKFKQLKGKKKSVWMRSIIGAGSKAALPITDLKMANEWYRYWKIKSNLRKKDFQLSEFLPGREFAVQTFWINGELYHAQARERLVYFFGSLMPSGQSSTPAVAKTINNQKVYNIAYKSIKAVISKPHGIYCVDIKQNTNKKLIPTEVNYGRFFTTSDFFSNVGINTPLDLVRYFVKGIKPKKKINFLKPNIYWIRGLDTEPKLIKKKK